MVTTAAAPTPAIRATPSGWISSPGWDVFWMFSAFWGCALLFLTSLSVGMAAAGAILFGANILIAVTHSWSTTWMVLGSRLLTDARRANRRKFTWIPLAVVSVSMLLGLVVGATQAYPATSQLGGAHWPWALYLALFWVGHFWHFGNQDFGVLSIYRLKAGQASTRDRRIDKAYAVAMMFAIHPVIYLKSVSSAPFSEAVFSYLPVSPALVGLLADGGLAVAVVLTVGAIGCELARPNTSTAKLLYYAIMFAHPAILYFVRFELGFYYLIAYFWSHWIIAIGLVGRINTNFQKSRGASPGRSVLRHLLTLLAVAGSASVVHALYSRYNVFSGREYKEILAAVPAEYAAILGLVLGFFLAEQLLHYYCDRCLFRFRDPAVRKAVAPLL